MHAFRRYLAEFIGTFIVVFIAAGAVVADVFLTRTRLADSFGPLGIVAAYGLAWRLPCWRHADLGGAPEPGAQHIGYVARRLSLAEAAGTSLPRWPARSSPPSCCAPSCEERLDFASGGVPAWQPASRCCRERRSRSCSPLPDVHLLGGVRRRTGPPSRGAVRGGPGCRRRGLAGSAFTGRR